jgi:hypothetical protein
MVKYLVYLIIRDSQAHKFIPFRERFILPERSRQLSVVLRSPSVLVPPLFLTIGSICEITSMRRKKRALRDPTGLTLDTLRSFFKPAPISSQEIDNMKKRLERYDPSVTPE